MRRFFNARMFHEMGWSNAAVEYLRLNDVDTTSGVDGLAEHIAAVNPHPQYTTDAEATVIAQTEATEISTGLTLLLMGG